MVDLVDVNKNDSNSIKCIIKVLRGDNMIFTKELLKSRNVSDIGSITIYSGGYINQSKNFTQEKIENIMFPT